MNFKIYLKWWKTWRTLPVLPWIKAAKLYKAGDYSNAAKFYRKGIKRNRGHIAEFSARLDLAYCLFKLRKISLAKSELKKVIQIRADFKEAYLRLARLSLWSGQGIDAAYILREALQYIKADEELAALFLISAIEGAAPEYLVKEAEIVALKFFASDEQSDLLRVARAKLFLYKNDIETGLTLLHELAFKEEAIFEAVLYYAEALIEDGDPLTALQHLRRALAAIPDHPEVLSLLAKVYLEDGATYNPEYSKQLALSACQATQWESPKELALLAECYHKTGDKMSALMVASKAKDQTIKLSGSFEGAKELEKLIESLSSGTQV